MEKRGFAVFMLSFGILGLLLMTHHIVSYEAILRPHMDYLMANKVITNDISGITFLRMFTNESNIFVDIYLILLLWAFSETRHFTDLLTMNGSGVQ